MEAAVRTSWTIFDHSELLVMIVGIVAGACLAIAI
jgi:hypothetical protein